MDEATIKRLLEEVKDRVDLEGILHEVGKSVDTAKLQELIKTGKIKEIAANYAYLGFMAGVEFTLRNLVAEEEDETSAS